MKIGKKKKVEKYEIRNKLPISCFQYPYLFPISFFTYFLKSFSKKILTILLITLFLLPSSTFSAENQDQTDGCAASTGGDSLADVAKFPIYQVFAPTMNKLTKVRLLFGGTNTPTIVLTVKDMGGNQIGQTSAIVSAGWVDFTFASALNLTSGLSYQIHLTREATALINWNYCQPASYSGGYAVTGGTIVPDKDYNFQTYGYNSTTPVPTPSTLTISPPTGLKAEDIENDSGGKVNLNWSKSSTANIDGYRIFRRSQVSLLAKPTGTNSSAEYSKIADVGSKFLEYEDTGLENGTTYLYVVRAYKGTNESANSNEATIVPKNNLAPSVPEKLRVTSRGKDYIEVAWDKLSDEAKLDKYLVRFGENADDVLDEVKVNKGVTFYRAQNLKANTRYYFRVAALGTNGESSGFSDFVTEVTMPQKEGLSWVWIVSIIVLVLASFGIYLYFANLKKWWPFRKRNSKSEIPLRSRVSLREINSKQTQNLSRAESRDSNIQNSETTDDDIKELPGKKGKW